MSNIGENIKRIRKLKKLTQEQLATQSGLSTMSIRRYESNERIPNLASVRKITSVLEVYMNELIVDRSEYSIEEIGQDFTNGSDTSNNSDNKEEQMQNLFFLLNEAGQDKALEQVALPELDAAQERIDTEVTDEMRKHDDDIMSDENF